MNPAVWMPLASMPTNLFPRGIEILAGILILAGVVRALRRSRGNLVAGVLFGLAGLALLAIGVWPAAISTGLAKLEYLTRIRLLMGLISFVVLTVTIESIRRSRLEERYALLWVFTGAMIFGFALFPRVLDFFCHLLGMQYVTFVVTIVFTFLLLVVFHFSLALSALHDDRARLAQRCALLEARVKKLEDQGGTGPSGDAKS